MASSGYTKGAQFVAYEAAAATSRKTTQVVMLYDGLIKIIQQAKQAIADNKFEERYNLLERSCQIVAGLQGCLDFENGGEVAQLLNDYYAAIEVRLIMIQGNNDLALCDQIVKELKIMRDSWAKVDKKTSGEEDPEASATGEQEDSESASDDSVSAHTPPSDAAIAKALASISVSV